MRVTIAGSEDLMAPIKRWGATSRQGLWCVKMTLVANIPDGLFLPLDNIQSRPGPPFLFFRHHFISFHSSPSSEFLFVLFFLGPFFLSPFSISFSFLDVLFGRARAYFFECARVRPSPLLFERGRGWGGGFVVVVVVSIGPSRSFLVVNGRP